MSDLNRASELMALLEIEFEEIGPRLARGSAATWT
jgi:hypothetical protein